MHYVQHNTIQYSTIQHNTVQLGMVWSIDYTQTGYQLHHIFLYHMVMLTVGENNGITWH